MGCLLCGKPIGMVRKLTDSEFCSSEHRRDWVEVRESVLVDRLKNARAGIERARDKYLVRKATPPPPPEPPLAAFMVQAPVEDAGTLVPIALGPDLSSATVVHPPGLDLSPGRPQVLAGFQPDFPWPAWNPGLRSFGDLGIQGLACSHALDYLRTAARVFGDWKPDVGRWHLRMGVSADTHDEPVVR
jgi:hypothetical protein